MQFGSKYINYSPVLISFPFHFEKIFFCSLFFLVVISVYKSITYLLFASNGTLLAYSVAVNNSINLKKGIMDLFSIGFAVCTLSGIACFWLFFKCIDWFEKI